MKNRCLIIKIVPNNKTEYLIIIKIGVLQPNNQTKWITPYSKMASDLCGYRLALVASFKIKYSFEF